MRSAILFLPVLLGLAAAACPAQETPSPSPSSSPPPTVERVGPTEVRVGAVRVDEKARTVRFAASVNQTEGIVEYLLVNAHGKTHESILRTDVEPFHLHTAMLLLGAKVPPPGAAGAAPPEAIDAAYLRAAPALGGDGVELSVSWTDPATNKPVTRRAEELILDGQTHAPMSAGAWTYNGSMFSGARFLAQAEGSFVAAVTDPAALVNNPRKGHDDDSEWSAARDSLPAQNTPVEFTIHLLTHP